MSCHYPIIIEAELGEPLVSYGDGLHIDGPLAYGIFMSLPQSEKNKIPAIESNWALDFDLPLGKWEHECDLPPTADVRLTSDGTLVKNELGYRGRVWGWRCSSAVAIGVIAASGHHLRKKPPIEEYVRYTLSKRAEIAMGPNKAKDLAFPTIIAQKLRWYALGDPEHIGWLLNRYVHSIGKLIRHGNGRVSRWSVKTASEDFSLIGCDGRPMRRLPAAMFPDRPSQMGSIRAPYFHRSRWAVTVAPEAWTYENH